MSKKRRREVIIIDDDEEDELEIAIKMSMEKLYNEDFVEEKKNISKYPEVSWCKAPLGESFFMNTIQGNFGLIVKS